MFKLIITFIVCLFSSLTFSQTTLFGTGTSTNTSTTNPAHRAGQLKPADIMSPDEFESRVKTLGQQNRAQLEQQVNKTLKPPVQQQSNTLSTSAPNTNSMNQTPAYNAVAPQSMQAPAAPTQPNAAPAPQSTQSIDQSAQGYTGFQGTGSSGNSSNQQSGNSGWNIKY